jgi:hypothetical protein
MTESPRGIGADGRRTDVPCLVPFGSRFFDTSDPTMAAAPTDSPI